MNTTHTAPTSNAAKVAPIKPGWGSTFGSARTHVMKLYTQGGDYLATISTGLNDPGSDCEESLTARCVVDDFGTLAVVRKWI